MLGFWTLVLVSGLEMALAVPMILKWVPPNRLYGFRTPATLANRALWYDANRFAGWALFSIAVSQGVILLILYAALQGQPGTLAGISAAVVAVGALVVLAASLLYAGGRS